MIFSPIDKNQGHICHGLYCNCRSLILTDVDGGCMWLVSVHSFAIAQAQMGLKLVSIIWNNGVSAVEGFFLMYGDTVGTFRNVHYSYYRKCPLLRGVH